MKFCGLQSEFLDYILIKKLLLTDASGTAYVENKEAHFSLLIASLFVTAKGHSSGPGDRLKSWAALSKHTDTPVQFQHSVPWDLSPTNLAHAAPLHSLVESHKETQRLTAKVKSAGKL